MSTKKWTANDIPDQTGRVALITGANAGLGYESAVALAHKGSQIVMACRDEGKAQKAISNLKQQIPEARVEFIQLDLANLASVRAFAHTFRQRYGRLDLLMNNAGVMAIPRRESVDGFEMQLATNHLGHFALTGLLLDMLVTNPASRVVTLSSGYHYIGRINFEDLQMRQKYQRYAAYSQSKLANLLFTFELQRRFEVNGYPTISVSAHPGGARTNLQSTSLDATGSRVERLFMAITGPIVLQPAVTGALPQLYAATAPDVKGAEFFGPRFFLRGYPVRAKTSAQSHNLATAQRLWSVSEELTGVSYSFKKQAA
jgi:NAD(P)-dependent dehydrogenase (short-subunit alcohol dehydrogenase family)